MKRSFTYLKGLLTLALAAFTGWIWAANPVVTWTDFSTLTSGDYTLTADDACTVNDDGSITLGGAGLSLPLSGHAVTVVMDVANAPTTEAMLLDVVMNGSSHVSLYSDGSKLYQKWNNGSNAYGETPNWEPTKRQIVRFAIKQASGEGTTTYIDEVQVSTAGGLMTTNGSLEMLYVGAYGDTQISPPPATATGMTIYSLSIYNTKEAPQSNASTPLDEEKAQIASTAWMASFNGDNTTSGWITGWGGEGFTTFVDTPNGKGGKVESGKHPWVNYTITKPYTIAYYADISEVAVSANGAALLALGTGGNNVVLTKTAANKVAVLRTGTPVDGLVITDDDLAKTGSYHLIVFSSDDNGSFLYVDGTKVTGAAIDAPAAGFQIGSMYGGIGNYVQAYNTIVDEVRGYSALLDDAALATLKAKFPEYLPPSAETTVEADAQFTELGLTEGDTTNITITLKDGVTLNMDKAPTCAMLTIVSEGMATVTTSVDAPFANVANLVLEGEAVTIPAQLPATVHMNATTVTFEGGATAADTVECATVITVANGKTLKTTGYLNFSGANTIAGTLEVVSGETTFNLASTGLNGTVKVASGATFKNGTNDGPNYNGSPTFDIAGTLEVTGPARWSLPASTTTTLREGAVLKGAGGTGYDYAYDYFAGATINALGNATIEGNIGAHSANSAITINVAENKMLTLSGAFDGGTWNGTSGLSVTGSGTLKLTNENSYRAGATIAEGAKVLVAHASALPGAIANNGTITYTVDATLTNTLTGVGVTGVDAVTLNLAGADLSGYMGSFAIVNGGTLVLPAGAEEGVTVGAGCTLKLALSVSDKISGYTSKATLDGGSITFVEADGETAVTEGVNGGTYAPADPIWTPVATDSAWDNPELWSTGTVATTGNVVIDYSALADDMAVELPAEAQLSTLTLRGGETNTLTLTLAEGASVTTIFALNNVILPVAVVGDTEVTITMAEAARLTVDVAEDVTLTMNKAVTLNNLTIAGDGTLTIAENGGNKLTVTGATTINTNVVATAGAAVLGQITIAEGKSLSIKEKIANVGNIASNAGTLVYAGGNITEDKQLTNVIGAIRIATGTVDFTAANGNYTQGAITIDAGATMKTTSQHAAPFGNSPIVNYGTIVVASTGTAYVQHPISGTGSLSVTRGTLSIAVENTYTGVTTIESGATLAGAGSLAGALTFADGATLAGAVTVGGDVTIGGALTITHATAAGDTVLTCANADAVAAALTGAPAGLKYVAEEGIVKLAEDAGSEEPGTGGEGGEEPDPEQPDPEEPTPEEPTIPSLEGAEAISVNFNGVDARAVSGAAGLYAIDGWNNFTTNNGTATELTVANGLITATQTMDLTFKSKNMHQWDDATDAFLKGYLDDGVVGDHNVLITVEDIPFSQYTLIVYVATDTPSYKFKPVQINDVSYIGSATYTEGVGYAEAAATIWGASQNATAVYGTNTLRLDGLTASTLIIKGGTNTDNARGCIAAFQIVNTGAPTLSDAIQPIDWTANGATEQAVSTLPELTKEAVELKLADGATLVIDQVIEGHKLYITSTGNVTIKVTNLSISQATLDAMLDTSRVDGEVANGYVETLGYTKDGVTYPLFFRGTTDANWATLSNWYTGYRTNGTDTLWLSYEGSVVPGAPSSEKWDATLIDGSFIGDNITADGETGYKVVNAPTLEGWAFKIAVANGVHVKIPTLNKMQGSSVIRVDGSSKVTVTNKGSGNNDTSSSYYIDAENGLVFENMPMPGGTAYLGTTGSITTGTFGNAQTIGSVKLDLGDSSLTGSEVVSRKLYTFTSGTDFTVAEGAVTTTVETVPANEVAEADELQNVGDYKFVKIVDEENSENNGYYVTYIAYAESGTEPDPGPGGGEEPDPEEPTPDYVAQIGETGYTTLAEAIAAVATSNVKTITLLKNTTAGAELAGITSSVTLSMSSGATLTTTADATVEGKLAGEGALVVQSGALTLKAANTYAGGTTVNGGSLVVNGAAADTVVLPEGKTVTVADGATLQLVQGLSYVKVEGEGTTEVTGTYTFGISRTLDTALATKTVTVAESGILQFRAWKAYAFSVASLTVNGTIKNDGYNGATVATMTVAENQTLSGSGTIELAVALADGATLAGAVTVNGDVTIGGTISITHAVNAGDVVLNCANAEAVATALGESYEADGTAVKVKATEPDPGPGGGEEPDPEEPTPDYVAQIGATGYTTLADAIDAVQTGETITLLKDATLEADTEIVTGVTLAMAGKTLTIPAGKTLTVTGAATGAVAGAGTIVYNGALQTDVTGLTAATWTGTVKLDNITTARDLNLSLYGNADSTIELGNLGSATTDQVYFPGSVVEIPTDVVISGTTCIRNGSSGGGCDFKGAIRGEGTLTFPEASRSFGTLKFYGDVSGFTGTINAPVRTGGRAIGKIVFLAEGSTTTDFANSVTTVADGYALTVNATYLQTINVLGTIKQGTGSLVALTLANGATIDASEAALVVTGDVTLPTDGTVVVTLPANAGVGTEVLVCANAAALDLTKFATAPEGLEYVVDGTTIKLAATSGEEPGPGTGGEGGEEPDPEEPPTVDYVAQIGETGYTTLADAIAAVQSGETIALLKDATIEADTEIITGATLAVTEDQTLTIAANKTLTVNGTLTGAVAGAGTLVCNGAQAGVTGLTAETWTGTVKLDGITTLPGFTFETYGNANSTIEFLSTASGYLAKAGASNANLIITGSITFNNGWSDSGGYAFNGALTGTGTLATVNDQTDVLKFLGETKDYAGTITVNGRHCIAFGEQADNGSAHEGKLVVAAGKTANIAAGKTWSATNGIEVAGTIGGEGTIGSTLILLDGATLANALTLTGNVTVAAGTAINHAYATQIGDTVITCANAAEVVANLTCVLSDLKYVAEGNAIKLAEGPRRIALPATPEHAKWYYNGVEVANAIEASISQSVTLQLKTDADYLFADGSTSKDVTVAAGETSATLPANVTVVAAVAKIGETLYLTLDAAFTVVQATETITLLQDATIEVNTEIIANVTLVVTTGKTLTIAANKTLTVNGTLTGAVAGAGTITYTGKYPTTTEGLNTDAWTGTIRIENVTGSAGQGAAELNLDAYCNNNSMLVLKDVTGWVAGGTTVNNLRLEGAGLTFNNGSTGSYATITINNLTGDGTVSGATGSNWKYKLLVKNVENFTGAVDLTAANSAAVCLVIGEDATLAADAKIVVAAGKKANIVAGKTWSATNGIEVAGIIGGEGTIGSTLILLDDATLANAFTLTGDVMVAAGTTINHGYATQVGDTVITCANAATVVTKLVCGLSGYTYVAEGIAVKLAEAKPDYVYRAVAGETNVWSEDAKWTLDGASTTAPEGEITKTVLIELPEATTLEVDTEVAVPFLKVTGGDLTLVGNGELTVAGISSENKVIVDGNLVFAGGKDVAPINVANVIEVNNGTLTTDGYVNLSNENNKIGASGTLVVANGVTSLNAAEQGIKGSTTIQAGATLKNVRSGDALAYNTSGVVVNVYGTLDMGETRWTIFANNNTINAYAGATITGAGQGANGALDVLEKTTGAAAINVLKNGDNAAVTISAKIRFREGTTNVNIAEGVTATLSAGTNGLNNNNGALRVAGAGTLKIADSAVYNIPVTVADATTTLVSANGKIKSLTLYGKLDSSKATLTTDTLTIYNGATLLNKPVVTGTVEIPNRGTLVRFGAYATDVNDVVMTCNSNANAKIVAALMKVTSDFYYVVDGKDVKLADRDDAAVRLGGSYGYYTTFEEAYKTLCETLTTPTGTALDRERTIALVSDVTMDKERSYDFTDLTLNLNGFNLMPMQCVFVGDNFTITNTEATGKIDGQGAPYALWIGEIEDANNEAIEAATNVTIENLTIDGGITLCNAHNVTLRNLTVLNANYEAIYVDAESEGITIVDGSYEGNKDWGSIGFNSEEYADMLPVTIEGANLEMLPAPLKVPTGLPADLIDWLKENMGDVMVGSASLDVTEEELDQARLLGILPEVTDQNEVNVESTFGVSEMAVADTAVTLTVTIAVQAGSLPDEFSLGGTVKLMAWETLADMDASIEVDPSEYAVEVTRVNETEATITVKPLVDKYKFFKVIVE